MNIESAQKDVDRAKTRLEQIQADLPKKQSKYHAAEESHTKHVAANVGRQRYPRSLQVQRESLLRLKLEIDTLEKAEKIAEQNLATSQTKLRLSELYDNTVKPYQQAEQVYFELTQELIVAVDELNEKTATVCAMADKFLEQANNPVGILRRVVNDPSLSGLSLRKFLRGEIAEETSGENGHFVDDLATRYGEITRRLPNANTAQESLEALSDHLNAISREANSLVPRHVKYILQAVPSKPERQVQRGQVLPRHARGGPDIDEKDDLRSPYWQRRRAALRPVIEPTVLGKAKT